MWPCGCSLQGFFFFHFVPVLLCLVSPDYHCGLLAFLLSVICILAVMVCALPLGGIAGIGRLRCMVVHYENKPIQIY